MIGNAGITCSDFCGYILRTGYSCMLAVHFIITLEYRD